jgi:NAD(P)-dependent dehydrogenase (short-subunit alcohol dehydrogenase family)
MAGKKLQGQVAIITGAGRGIGAATADRFVAAGAAVVLSARTEEEVEAVAARLRKRGAKAIAVPGDITDPETVEEVVESALEQFDRVDILINNAGVGWPIEELAETDADEWTYNIHVNLIAPFYMIRSVLPLMLDQNYGRIVSVSSGVAGRPIAGLSAFCSAKAGLDMLMQTLALELAGRKVSASTLYPGMVDTTLQEDVRSIDTADTALDFSTFHDAHVRGALRSPAQIADLLYWMVGPWSRNRNGQSFAVDDQAWVDQVVRDLT